MRTLCTIARLEFRRLLRWLGLACALLLLTACPSGDTGPDGRERGWPIAVDVSEAPDWCAELCAGCVTVEGGSSDCESLRADCACPTEGSE